MSPTSHLLVSKQYLVAPLPTSGERWVPQVFALLRHTTISIATSCDFGWATDCFPWRGSRWGKLYLRVWREHFGRSILPLSLETPNTSFFVDTCSRGDQRHRGVSGFHPSLGTSLVEPVLLLSRAPAWLQSCAFFSTTAEIPLLLFCQNHVSWIPHLHFFLVYGFTLVGPRR